MQCRTIPHTGQKKCRRDSGASRRRMRSRAHLDNELLRALGNEGGVPAIQAKLTVGAAGDEHEREADQVADMVMRMPSHTSGCGCGACRSRGMSDSASSEPSTIMRKGIDGASCSSSAGATREGDEEEEEGGAAQRKESNSASAAGGAATKGFEHRLTSRRGGGQPLPGDVRAFMEPRFQYDFSDVRVHADDDASMMAEEIDAEAFTTGRDLYFRSGRYNPSSERGRWLLAHELTHVMQQSSGEVGDGSVSRHIQRYSLNGFPATEEAAMKAAIPLAISTVKSCSALGWLRKQILAAAINTKRYDYVPDLGHCGWTFPASWYIEIGKSAFDHSKCCDLASTIAHEASHTEWHTEGAARRLECNCFGCSC